MAWGSRRCSCAQWTESGWTREARGANGFFFLFGLVDEAVVDGFIVGGSEAGWCLWGVQVQKKSANVGEDKSWVLNRDKARRERERAVYENETERHGCLEWNGEADCGTKGRWILFYSMERLGATELTSRYGPWPMAPARRKGCVAASGLRRLKRRQPRGASTAASMFTGGTRLYAGCEARYPGHGRTLARGGQQQDVPWRSQIESSNRQASRKRAIHGWGRGGRGECRPIPARTWPPLHGG